MVCSRCGLSYEKGNGGYKYCDSCKEKAKKEMDRERHPKKNLFYLKVRICDFCGKIFNQGKVRESGYRTYNRCCSNECARLSLKKLRKDPNEILINKRLRHNEYYARRKKVDPQFHLSLNMRSATHKALRTGKMGRKWESLVGYTALELRKHLEKQFKIGMSWDNYGEWHIDHIIPKSVFHYDKAEHIDFKRCWSLSNLQPLWGQDNIKKRDKLNTKFQPSLRMAI